MKATLIRFRQTQYGTIGFMRFDDPSPFECFTCEDAIRDVKIKGQTCIPAGIYTVKPTWSNRFQKNMWEIMNVPNFEGIRIHAGNTPADTEGCVLIGKSIGVAYDCILGSRECLYDFNRWLAANNVTEFTLEIRQ